MNFERGVQPVEADLGESCEMRRGIGRSTVFDSV